MFSNAMRLVLLVVCVLTCGGCSGKDQTVLRENTTPNTIVSGRVIDGSTRKPVGGAEVTLLCNGTKLSVTTNNSTDPDLAGTFVFNGVVPTAYATGYDLIISASGYAIFQNTVPVPVPANNIPVAVALGNITLGKSCDVTVIVTDNGVPVPAVVVSASSQYSVSYAISAVTDVNGTAILKSLNQESTYSFMTAPAYDTNGTILYPATTLSSNYQPQNSARTVSIALIPAMRDDAIQIIASNLLSDGPVMFNGPNQKVIKSDSVIKIVFNYPVELTGNVSATYQNNLVPSTDPNYGKALSVTTLSGSLDSTGTILTVANSSPYIKNQSYTFVIPVFATVNGRKQAYDFSTSSHFFSNPIYVTDGTSSGLGPDTILKADNFNGTSGASATSSSAMVYVEFPEKVFGSYQIISTRNGSTVTPFSNLSRTFSDGEMLFASNSGGADGAVVFRLPLSMFLPDNQTGSPSEVTVSFDVMDAEGFRFNKTLTLPVQ